MPLPDLSIFGSSELRNFLRTAGQELFTEYTSGASLLSDLRAAGGAIRDADFYDIRRQVLGLGRYTEQLQNRDDDQLIPQAWTYKNSGLALSSDYLYRVKAIGTDPSTGQQIERFFSVASNDQLTPGQVKDVIGTMVVGEEGFYGINVDHFELFEALGRG